MTQYDAVLKIKPEENDQPRSPLKSPSKQFLDGKPAYEPLPQAKVDCDELRKCMEKFGVTDPNDIYEL